MLRSRLLFLIFGVIINTCSQAAVLPQPFTANYHASKRVLFIEGTAHSEVRLRRSEKYIKITNRINVEWALYKREFFDCSIILIKDGFLYPLEFRHIDDKKSKSNTIIKFDWENSRATTIKGDRPSSVVDDISWPTWDPMSLLLAIATTAPDQAPGSVKAFQVLRKGKMTEYNLHFNGEVDIDTVLPGKAFEITFENSKYMKTLWLAPKYHWAPTRIQMRKTFVNLQSPPIFLPVDGDNADEIPKC